MAELNLARLVVEDILRTGSDQIGVKCDFFVSRSVLQDDRVLEEEGQTLVTAP